MAAITDLAPRVTQRKTAVKAGESLFLVVLQKVFGGWLFLLRHGPKRLMRSVRDFVRPVNYFLSESRLAFGCFVEVVAEIVRKGFPRAVRFLIEVVVVLDERVASSKKFLSSILLVVILYLLSRTSYWLIP